MTPAEQMIAAAPAMDEATAVLTTKLAAGMAFVILVAVPHTDVVRIATNAVDVRQVGAGLELIGKRLAAGHVVGGYERVGPAGKSH